MLTATLVQRSEMGLEFRSHSGQTELLERGSRYKEAWFLCHFLSLSQYIPLGGHGPMSASCSDHSCANLHCSLLTEPETGMTDQLPNTPMAPVPIADRGTWH